MNCVELDRLTPKYIVDTGHGMCHPETCTCWNFRVYEKDRSGKKGKNVLNSDSSKDVMVFLSENDPDYKG